MVVCLAIPLFPAGLIVEAAGALLQRIHAVEAFKNLKAGVNVNDGTSKLCTIDHLLRRRFQMLYTAYLQ